MTLPVEPDQDALARASRRAAVATALGALLVVSAIAFSALRLRYAEAAVAEKTQRVAHLETVASDAVRRVEALRSTQGDILDFLAHVTEKEAIRLIDKDVDWPRTRSGVLELPPGRRKQAVLGAVLLAWKDIPFKLGGSRPASGFDSPRFIQFLLDRVGIHVTSKADERLSVSMMRQFTQFDAPEPGDLMFYKGAVGNFVMIYLGPGQARGQGVCVGTFEAGQPVQVMDSANFNTAVYPFIGYYQVPY